MSGTVGQEDGYRSLLERLREISKDIFVLGVGNFEVSVLLALNDAVP